MFVVHGYMTKFEALIFIHALAIYPHMVKHVLQDHRELTLSLFPLLKSYFFNLFSKCFFHIRIFDPKLVWDNQKIKNLIFQMHKAIVLIVSYRGNKGITFKVNFLFPFCIGNPH